MRSRLVVPVLSLVITLPLVACGQAAGGARPQAAPVVIDQAGACSAAGQAMDDAERLAGEAMGGRGAELPTRLAEVTAALRSAGEGDTELDAVLERHADEVTIAIETLAGNDPAKVEALDTDAVVASEAAVRKLCDAQSPSVAPVDQALVRNVCGKVTAIEQGDGVKAAGLWRSALVGSSTADDRERLAGLWDGMSRAYNEPYFDIPIDDKSLGDFRSALFQVGSAYDIAAVNLRGADGVAKTRDYLGQDVVKGYFATVQETCGP